MLRWIAAIMLLTVLGCAEPLKMLEPQLVDDTFQKHTVKWAGTFDGMVTTNYAKTFDSGGKLAVCFVREELTGSMAIELADVWHDAASVTVGNKVVSPATFVRAELPDKRELWANCVETKVSSEGKLYLPVRIRGAAVTVSF